MKAKLPNIAPKMAPSIELELGSLEVAAGIGVVVWAAGAGAVVLTGLAIAVVVVVAEPAIAVLLAAATLAFAVLDGLGVAAGSVPARSMVVVYVV